MKLMNQLWMKMTMIERVNLLMYQIVFEMKLTVYSPHHQMWKLVSANLLLLIGLLRMRD